jgi:tetratricopeptide (TPR) repeat protein
MAAQLAALGVRETEAALEELVESGLLQPAADGRYRFHDLVRLFARARLTEEEPPQVQREVEDGMVTWLLGKAVAAGRWFEPEHAGSTGDGGPASAEQAKRWIRRENLNWLGGLRAASAAGRYAEVMEVADAMHWFSDQWHYWGHWLEVFQMSAAAAKALGDVHAQAVHLNYVSWAYTICESRPDLADAPAREALALARAAGDLRQQGWAWFYLGFAAVHSGDPARAGAAARESLVLLEAAADWDGYSQALSLLGSSLAGAGRHREAIAQYRRLEALLADPSRGPSPLIRNWTLGHVHLRVGMSLLALRRWTQAAATFQTALPLLQRSGARQGQARCRHGLGTALARLGRVEEARNQLLRALRVCRQIGMTDLADEVLAMLAAPTTRSGAAATRDRTAVARSRLR